MTMIPTNSHLKGDLFISLIITILLALTAKASYSGMLPQYRQASFQPKRLPSIYKR